MRKKNRGLRKESAAKKQTRSAPFAKQHDVDRFQDDRRIEHEGKMANVVEVVFQFAERVFHVGAVGIIDLRPTGDAGFHEVAKMIAGNVALVVFNETVPFGARTDE